MSSSNGTQKPPQSAPTASPLPKDVTGEEWAAVESARAWSAVIAKFVDSPTANKLLDSVSGARDQGAKTARLSLYIFGAYSVVTMVFLYMIAAMLKDQKDVLLPVMTAVIGLIAGTGGILIGRGTRG